MIKANIPKKDIMDSLAFRAEIAEGLCLLGKGENKAKNLFLLHEMQHLLMHQ